jgi:hypothetical protein
MPSVPAGRLVGHVGHFRLESQTRTSTSSGNLTANSCSMARGSRTATNGRERTCTKLAAIPSIRPTLSPRSGRRISAAVSISAAYPSRVIQLERNQQSERVKSTGPVALHSRPVFCVVLRLVYDPLPIPVGLLPRHNLHRLVEVSLDVADRELLGLDLLHLLVSQLSF